MIELFKHILIKMYLQTIVHTESICNGFKWYKKIKEIHKKVLM